LQMYQSIRGRAVTLITSTPYYRFFYHRLQRFFVQTQIGHQLLQSAILIAQLLGFLGLAHFIPPHVVFQA
jgi:hypothetical protein